MGALRVAAVGEVSVDVYDELGLDVLGGCSCNLARAAAASGAAVSLFAPLGGDARGRRARAAIETLPLTSHVRLLGGQTAVQHIQIRADGERELGTWHPGVVATYVLEEGELERLSRMDVIAFADTPAKTQCRDVRGPRRVADFSQDARTPWDFDQLDVAFVGGSPADLGRLKAAASSTLIVLTAGAAGAWAVDRGRVLHQPSLATNIVDTTGCGDAFQGSFIAVYFSGGGVDSALAAGAAAAAMVAAVVGASGDPIILERDGER